MATEKREPEVIVWLTERSNSGCPSIELGFSIAEKGNRGQHLHDCEVSDDLNALRGIGVHSFVYEEDTPRLIGYEEVDCTLYRPSVEGLTKVLPVMKRLNKAIQKARSESEDYSFAAVVVALMRATKANVLHYRALESRSHIEVFRSSVHAEVTQIAWNFAQRWGKTRRFA